MEDQIYYRIWKCGKNLSQLSLVAGPPSLFFLKDDLTETWLPISDLFRFLAHPRFLTKIDVPFLMLNVISSSSTSIMASGILFLQLN